MLCQIYTYTEILLVIEKNYKSLFKLLFLKYLVYGIYLEIVVVSSDKLQVFPWKTEFKELVLCITFSHSSMSHIKEPLPNILLNRR